MKHPESQLQKQIVEYLRLNHVFVFAVPNGVNVKSPRTRAELQRMGLTSGVSDLIIIRPYGRYLCVELKFESGKQSPAQIEFEQKIISMGGEYEVWNSVIQAENWVKLNKNNI